MPWKNKEKSSQSPSLHKQAIPQHPLFLFPQRPVEGGAADAKPARRLAHVAAALGQGLQHLLPLLLAQVWVHTN